MHFAVVTQKGETVVFVRAHKKDLHPKEIGRPVTWGPEPVCPEARFLLKKEFLNVLPPVDPSDDTPAWDVRLQMIASALITQGWNHAGASRRRNHAVARHPDSGMAHAALPGLPDRIVAWMEQLSAREIPANELEKNSADLVKAFEGLHRMGREHKERHDLSRAGA